MARHEVFHDYDLDGEDMFLEFVEQGLDILRSGKVAIPIHDSFVDDKIIEDDIKTPEEAAYYTLLARGLAPQDTVGVEFKLHMTLGRAIRRRVPNPDQTSSELPNPPYSGYITYYQKPIKH